VAFASWWWLASVRQHAIESDLEAIQFTDYKSEDGKETWLHTVIARFRSTGEVCGVFVEEVPILDHGKHKLPVGIELMYLPGRLRVFHDGMRVNLCRGKVLVHCRNISGLERGKQYTLNSSSLFSTNRLQPVSNLEELFEDCLK
jgi:hypothetical protein